MSGGHFDYKQYIIDDIACSVEEYVDGRELDSEQVSDIINDKWEDKEVKDYVKEHKRTVPNRYGYSDATIASMKDGIYLLQLAQIYAQRIDWLLSGDDGEESFQSRLKEETEALNKKYGIKDIAIIRDKDI